MTLTKNGRTVIGIMGLGVVGDAVRDLFEQQGYSLRVYDPERGLGSQRSINEADLVFVCVHAPFRPHAGFDDSALEEAVSLLDGSKVIVIKSTVLPGTTEAYQIRYASYLGRYRYRERAIDESDEVLEMGSEIYWWRCFIAAAQRRMKKPIQSAARWKGIAS